MWVDRMPRSAALPLACTPRKTTAPAPSPNNTQVDRSCQSRMREKVSAPITRAVFAWPRWRGGGKGLGGRGGGADDEVAIVRRHAGRRQRRLRRGDRQVRGVLAVGG